MEHPRLKNLYKQSNHQNLPPIVSQLINFLKQFMKQDSPLDLKKIKTDIRNSVDLPIHLQKSQETLLRHYYLQLFRKVLRSSNQQPAKLSCIKVCIATAIEAKINLTIQDFYQTITQLSKIVMETQNYQYLLIINYVIYSQKQDYKYSFNFLKLPHLLKLMKKLQPEYQIRAAQILIDLIVCADPLDSQMNKIIIKKQIKWTYTLFFNILKCSNLIINSLVKESFCMDPFNIQAMWGQVINQLQEYQRTRDVLFRKGLQEIQFPNIVLLHKQLDLPVILKQMQQFNFRKYKIIKGKDAKMISNIWCRFSQNHFYQSFQYQDITSTEQKNKISQQSNGKINVDQIMQNSNYLIDLILYVLETHLDATKSDHNYFWLDPIYALLEYGYNYKKQHLFNMFCQFLVENDLPYILFEIVKKHSVSGLTISTLQNISNILSMLWVGNPKGMCISVKYSFSLRDANNKAIYDQMRRYMTKYLIHSLVYYRNYNENYQQIRKQFTLQSRDIISATSSIFQKEILINSSQLFIATNLLIPDLEGTSLLLAILLVSDVNLVFNDWLKYQFKDKILQTETNSQFTITKFDQAIGKRFKEWIEYYDQNDRQKIQRMFKMEYTKLRKMVKSLLEIFTNEQSEITID